MTCTVTARVCQEAEAECGPADKKKKIVVVGGGPAGMEVARIASDRGHEVTVYEKAEQLGGVLNAGSHGQGKEFRKYLVNELARTGVEVRLSTPVDADLVAFREARRGGGCQRLSSSYA